MDIEKIMNGLQAIAENKECQNCQDIARNAIVLLKEQKEKIVYLQERGDRALDNLQAVLKERLQDDRE